MLADEKILVTGVSGMVGTPIASYLAHDDEVWGIKQLAPDDGPHGCPTTRIPCRGTQSKRTA